MIKHPLRDQSALYALGVLEGEDLHLFEKHLEEGCAMCRDEVQSFDSAMDRLGWAVQDVPPPPSLRQKICTNLSRLTPSQEVTEKPQPE